MIDLKPGRELDALVAEKVMGWKRMTYAEQYALRDSNSHSYANDHRLTGHWHSTTETDLYGCFKEMYPDEEPIPDDGCGPERWWNPSEDIAAAWEVVEKLTTTTKQWFDVTQYSTGCTAVYEVTGMGDQDVEHTVEAPTAPHAICLAALRAVGFTASSKPDAQEAP